MRTGLTFLAFSRQPHLPDRPVDARRRRTPPPTCAASTPSATASPGPPAPTAPSSAPKTAATSGNRCAIPPDAEHLDFRGIQAFDANTAIVMSSGKGDLSRLYKTTDGCHTWKLLFTNPDKDGFWDAILLNRCDKDGYLLGDPCEWTTSRLAICRRKCDVAKRLARREFERTLEGLDGATERRSFAASNSVAPCAMTRYVIGFVTGGPAGGRVFYVAMTTNDRSQTSMLRTSPLATRSASAIVSGGAYSHRLLRSRWPMWRVGGDYTKPNDSAGTAAYSTRWRRALAARPNPTPRLPLRRSLRRHHQNLDHRRPQRHRHLHRRRPQLARPPS